jgi:4-hydroxyacetophenone monooxygenase
MQDELRRYVHETARKHGVHDHTVFSTKVESAHWDESNFKWDIVAIDPSGKKQIFSAELLFSAVGILNIPKRPQIAGLDSFAGPVVHTSDWPEHLDLAGKRVAVVGNGASAMQLVPAIVDDVAELTIFARSKQWVAPFPYHGQPMPGGLRYLMKVVPLYRAWFEQRLAWMFNDRVYPSMIRDPNWPHPDRAINSANDRHRHFFTEYIREQLGDRQDLLPTVLPDYPPYLKRMVLDNGWFKALQKPNVTLIADGVSSVDGNRLISTSGRFADADVVVLATGFNAAEMMSSLDIVGRCGRRLREFWKGDEIGAYLGTLVTGFPNMFVLVGPNTGSGHGGSMMRTMENQIHFSLRVIDRMIHHGAKAAEVSEQAYLDYCAEVDSLHQNLMWTHPGTGNWFRNKGGRVTTITPWRNDQFWRMTREPNDEHMIYFWS